MAYQTHHLKLMQTLDQHHVSCALTEAWMERYCGTKYLDKLTAKQAALFLGQLEGSIGEVLDRIETQVQSRKEFRLS